MPAPNVRIITENLVEQRFLEAIFHEEQGRGEVEVSSWLTSSAAVGVAEYSLLEHPERPIALVLNTNTEDPIKIEQQRQTVQRILTRASPGGWHVALAIPKVDNWVMADDRIRRKFEDDEVTRRSRYERAVRIGDLVRSKPIDREAIARAYPDFRALAEFIERHTLISQPTP